MDRINTIKNLLAKIGLPPRQQTDLCALTILALCSITKKSSWSAASNEWVRIHDIITFCNTHFDVNYAENSRETFRKQALHHFRIAALVEDNGKATNSPNYRWRLTPEFLLVIRSLGEETNKELDLFLKKHQRLIDVYASKKAMAKMPVMINGEQLTFSPGKHNLLQKAIIEDFAPRFAPNSECLYVGDTTQKDLVKQNDKLTELGFSITLHDKMPDVVLYRKDKGWIYFIEAVTSVGPMDTKRIIEIKSFTEHIDSGRIYVTAFLDFATYKKFSHLLAWETEVWIADMPDHMIHLNGDKFLGPR